jgi:hypothetical protein
MRLHRIVLLAFSLPLLAFGQPASGPKLGADAPAMGYKEVPEWPTPVLNAAGTPGGPWNFIQVSGVAVDAQGHILVLHRGAHPIMEFESNGKFVRSWGDGMFSEGKVGAIALRSLQPTACRAMRFTRLFMDPRDAIPAARIPFAWTRSTTSGSSTLLAT